MDFKLHLVRLGCSGRVCLIRNGLDEDSYFVFTRDPAQRRRFPHWREAVNYLNEIDHAAEATAAGG